LVPLEGGLLVMNTTLTRYQHALRRCLRALAYLQEHVLPVGVIRRCGLGYADNHTLEADYAELLAELAKYGGSLTLATQTLGALATVGGDQHLPHAVFANIDHLFAFKRPRRPTRKCSPGRWARRWKRPTWWSCAITSAMPAPEPPGRVIAGTGCTTADERPGRA
jgi:hypothetical protein